MIGSIVISSKGTPQRLPLFSAPLEGKHTDGLNKGVWWFEAPEVSHERIYLPQRDRVVDVHFNQTQSEDFDWSSVMASWDVQDKTTQYERLTELNAQLPSYISHCAIHTQPVQGSTGTWSLIRTDLSPIYLYGVVSDRTVYLVWSTEDIVNTLRTIHPNKYSIFRFSPFWRTFLNTSAICGKWWRWSQSFNSDTLKMFNALEVMLLKVK